MTYLSIFNTVQYVSFKNENSLKKFFISIINIKVGCFLNLASIKLVSKTL